MSRPRTSAGRALHRYRHRYSACVENDTACDLTDAIADIEAETIREWLRSPEAERRLATIYVAADCPEPSATERARWLLGRLAGDE